MTKDSLALTYLTAAKDSPCFFEGAAIIKTTVKTPGELGRRKAQLAAVVERALDAETPLLILPGEFEPGVSFALIPTGGAPLPKEQADPEASPFAVAEAELTKREEALAERELAIVEREKKLAEKKASK